MQKLTEENNKLKESYSEEKFGKKTKFEYFKKTITLPGRINNKKTSAKFEKGRLKITIPKTIFSRKIEIK
ncbi:MAG: Hsp20 family protein [Nitrosarchaeum sp.]